MTGPLDPEEVEDDERDSQDEVRRDRQGECYSCEEAGRTPCPWIWFAPFPMDAAQPRSAR